MLALCGGVQHEKVHDRKRCEDARRRSALQHDDQNKHHDHEAVSFNRVASKFVFELLHPDIVFPFFCDFQSRRQRDCF